LIFAFLADPSQSSAQFVDRVGSSQPITIHAMMPAIAQQFDDINIALRHGLFAAYRSADKAPS
jgi:hypothetical protein